MTSGNSLKGGKSRSSVMIRSALYSWTIVIIPDAGCARSKNAGSIASRIDAELTVLFAILRTELL